MASPGLGAEKSSASAQNVSSAMTTKPRPPSSVENGLKKGPWTPAEDAILVEYVKKQGEGNWNAVQRTTGLARCGKSCRLRWANHLRPNLRKGVFTPEEEMLILRLHSQIGNKWARMAAQLPGRTDNEIKNYWNTRIKRRQRAGLPLYPSEMRNKSSSFSQLSSTSPSMSSTQLSVYPSTSSHAATALPLISPRSATSMSSTLRPLPPSSASGHKAKYLSFRPAPLMNATSFKSPTMPSGSLSLPVSPYGNQINYQFSFSPVSSLSPAMASVSPTTTLLSPTRPSLNPLLHQHMQQFGLGSYSGIQPLLSPALPKYELPSSQMYADMISSAGCLSRPSSNSNNALLQDSRPTARDFKVEDLLFDSSVEKAMESEYSMEGWCNNGGDEAVHRHQDTPTHGLEDFDIGGELNNKPTDLAGSLHDDLTSMFDMPVATMSLNPDWYSMEDAEVSDRQYGTANNEKLGLEIHHDQASNISITSFDKDRNGSSCPWSSMPDIC